MSVAPPECIRTAYCGGCGLGGGSLVSWLPPRTPPSQCARVGRLRVRRTSAASGLSFGASQPPLKPARSSPVRMAVFFFITFQTKSLAVVGDHGEYRALVRADVVADTQPSPGTRRPVSFTES